MEIPDIKTTDLLYGISSIVLDKKQGFTGHFFFCDLDGISEGEVMQKIGKILFDRHKFGRVYLVESGRENSWHILNFTENLSIDEYVEILKEMGADEKFIEWIKKVHYGILRLSRRSSHKKVPVLKKVLLSPHPKVEDVFCREFYFTLLRLEKNYEDIKRVSVIIR